MQKRLGKKGATNAPTWIVVALMVIVVGGGFTWAVMSGAFKTTEQTFAGTPEEITLQQEKLALASPPKVVLLKINAYDVASATPQTRVDVPVYCWKTNDPKELKVNAQVTSTSADTSVTVFSTGDNIHCEGFNGTYYSDVRDNGDSGVEMLLKIPTESIKVPVRTIATTGPLVELKTKSSYMDASRELNATGLTASADFSWDYISVKNNNTYSAFMLKTFGVDVVADTNVSDITILKGDGTLNENTARIVRLGDSVNYRFDLPSAKRLDPSEVYTTGSFNIKVDGDGCENTGTNSETITLYVIDEQQFVSAKSDSLSAVLKGIENDATTPADVGASDESLAFYCVSGTAGSG